MALDVSSGHHVANHKESAEFEDRDTKTETFQWWPDPLSKEDEELRRRAGRLLESLRRIPPLAIDIQAWENDHEDVFSQFRRGCLDGMTTGMLEAPIYHNRQIEDAWLFLFEMRRRHPNRRKQVVECATSLGASYNWSMVLHGSRKIRASLESLLPALQKEILEAANALELLAALSPNAPAVASTALPFPPCSGNAPAVASTAPSAVASKQASNPHLAVASNGYLATTGCRGSQEERRPGPIADFRGPEERRPSGSWPQDEAMRSIALEGSWPQDEALSSTWPLDAQSNASNTASRSQGEQHDRNPPFSGNPSATWPGGAGGPGNMPQRSGPSNEWSQTARRQSSSQRKPDHSRNPFGGGALFAPPAVTPPPVTPPPVSPGAHLLSASFGFSPAGSRETRADTLMPSFPRGDEKRQSFPQRRHSTSFSASEPSSPAGSQWPQAPSWAPSSASTPFGRPPMPNPNNPFMPRARQQDSSLQRPTTPINGSSTPYGSSPSTPMPTRAPEQDHSRQEANGAASGDPAAIARSMASRTGTHLSSASRSATALTQNAVNHARNMATQDKREDSPPGSSPAPGTSGQVRSQAASLGQRFGSAVGTAGTKASVATRSGVAALSSKTGSRPVSRASSPEGRSSTPAVPASWAPSTVPWASSPTQPRNCGSSSGPPPRAVGSDRWPDDGWS